MGQLDPLAYQIYVCRGRTYQEPADEREFTQFQNRFWDGRLFGNTVIEKKEVEAEDEKGEEVEDKKAKKGKSKGKKESGRFIRTGVAIMGIGISAAKVRIQRDTNTVKAAVQAGKDRGMAPLGFRIVEHGVYAMPLLINPTAAKHSLCTRDDVELMSSSSLCLFAQCLAHSTVG